ncbi:MAG TPA: hypothetical protein V6C88_18585 [Chroococcidiopsis sp.]
MGDRNWQHAEQEWLSIPYSINASLPEGRSLAVKIPWCRDQITLALFENGLIYKE